MNKNLKRLGMLSTAILLAACSVDKSNSRYSKPEDENQFQAHTTIQKLSQILITDTYGAPVSGAQVMIGTAPNKPFANNIVTTDKTGSFVPPKDWNSELPLTITANGYVRTTYMAQVATQKTFIIRAIAPLVKPELNGVTNGFDELKKDGFVDVGIVIPALTRLDLASFQPSALMSPELDTIKTAGQTLYVPSNITFPEQSETYIIVSVKFNKPNYRMFVDRHANYKVVSAHVKFPLKKVISDSQNGKTGIDLVNNFTFLEAGVNNTLIASDKQTVDLAVNQLQFNSTVQAQAPTIAATQGVLAVAMAQDGDQLYPTDIKNLASNETRNLSFASGKTGVVMGVLHSNTSRGAGDDFMSVQLKPSSQTSAFDFLPMIAAPKYSNGILSLYPPSVPAGMNAIATLSTLSTIVIKPMGKGSYETKNPEWDVYAPGWLNEIDLPEMSFAIEANRAQRWESTFLGGAKVPTELGPGVMNSVTHLTRSAVDL